MNIRYFSPNPYKKPLLIFDKPQIFTELNSGLQMAYLLESSLSTVLLSDSELCPNRRYAQMFKYRVSINYFYLSNTIFSLYTGYEKS